MDAASAWLEGYQGVISANQHQQALQQQAVDAQMRQQEAQARLAQESQMQQKQIEHQTMLDKQRMAVQAQIQQQQIDLQRQRLKDQEQQAAAKTADAADVIAQRRGFYQAVQSGVPTEKAAFMFPKAVAPGTVEASTRDAEKAAERRAALSHKMDTDWTKESAQIRQQEDKKKADAAKTAASERANKEKMAFDREKLGVTRQIHNLADPNATPAPTAAAAPAALNPGEILRYDAKGRAVIYDSQTKKPLRYAE